MWSTIVCVFVLLGECVHGQDGGLVSTSVGQIRGVRRENFTSYLGIPYGVIDGDNVFGAAVTPPHFYTEFLAYDNPPVCPQINAGVPQGTIQCLNLNVYVPTHIDIPDFDFEWEDIESSEWGKPIIYPVMVFIHGGAFVEGNGNMASYSPKFLLRHGVIVVTVNYRLGPYGFLCLPDLGYSNQGLKDIIMALKWVKDNIRSFGGDDENITLFGHSSGSVSVDFLLLYNEDNVFRNVILQSGQVVTPFMVAEPANERFVTRLAAKLQVDMRLLKINDVVKALSIINTDLLINATRFDEFRPCIDGQFITQTPKHKNMNETNIMVGTTSREMIFFYKGNESTLEDDFKKHLNRGFTDLPNSVMRDIKKNYPGSGVNKIIDAGTDFVFNYPAARSMRFYALRGAVVYRYVFSYDGGRNFMKIRDNITAAGAAHGDELGYIFDNKILGDTITEQDQRVIDSVTEIWTKFAKYGDPTPLYSDVNNAPWFNINMDTWSSMNIGSNLEVEDGPLAGRMTFWDKFYNYYGILSKGFNFGEPHMPYKSAGYVSGSSGLSCISILLVICLSARRFI